MIYAFYKFTDSTCSDSYYIEELAMLSLFEEVPKDLTPEWKLTEQIWKSRKALGQLEQNACNK